MAVVISSDLLLGYFPTPGGQPLNNARIGYQNFITDVGSAITATDSDADFPVENLTNVLTWARWKPATMPAAATIELASISDVDYIAIAAHTLHRTGTVMTIEYSLNGVDWFSISDFSPGNGNPVMFLFDSISARYFRMSLAGLSGSTLPTVGVVYIGQALAMQQPLYGGHSPITLSRTSEVIPNESESGNILGVSVIRKGNRSAYQFNDLEPDWYREKFDPFVKFARGKPVFVAWNPLSYPDEVGFGLVSKDIKPTNQGRGPLMEVAFSLKGYSDD